MPSNQAQAAGWHCPAGCHSTDAARPEQPGRLALANTKHRLSHPNPNKAGSRRTAASTKCGPTAVASKDRPAYIRRWVG